MPDAVGNRASHYAGSTCLVTGGLGFIGSNLALALAEAGASVTVVDSLEPRHGGDRDNVAGTEIEVVIADIAERDAVAAPLSGADFVFNLAGQVSHLDSMTDPLHDLDINARSQLAFLEHVRRINPGVSVVYASTRQVYGRPQTAPVDESHPLDPVDVNGVSKLAPSRSTGSITACTRFPRACCGFRTSTARASGSTAITRAFCRLRRRALEGEPITVFGDGSQRRDCLYVDDAVTALLAAADNPSASARSSTSATTITRACSRSPCRRRSRRGAGEVVSAPWPEDRARIAIDSYWTDHSKATRMLGWEPTWSLADGLAATLEHYRSAGVAWRA